MFYVCVYMFNLFVCCLVYLSCILLFIFNSRVRRMDEGKYWYDVYIDLNV